jgi:hypothetical protein
MSNSQKLIDMGFAPCIAVDQGPFFTDAQIRRMAELREQGLSPAGARTRAMREVA